MRKLIAICLAMIFVLSCCTTLAEEWVCPECGKTNSKNFCPDCGTEKPGWICPDCGEKNTGRFCENCGTAKPNLSGYDINTAKSSVVRIITFYTVIDANYPQVFGLQGYVTGSGFAIGKVDDAEVRYVATSSHVVLHHLWSGDVNAETIVLEVVDGKKAWVLVRVDEIHVLVEDASSYVIGNTIAWSSEADVAVLELNAAIPRKAAIICDRRGEDFKVNEQLTAMGFPSENDYNMSAVVTSRYPSQTEDVSVNTGAFTAWNSHAATSEGDQITTTAEMSPGISGGPLVDRDGYVVGVCSSNSWNSAVASDELLKLLNSISQIEYDEGPLK